MQTDNIVVFIERLKHLPGQHNQANHGAGGGGGGGGGSASSSPVLAAPGVPRTQSQQGAAYQSTYNAAIAKGLSRADALDAAKAAFVAKNNEIIAAGGKGLPIRNPPKDTNAHLAFNNATAKPDDATAKPDDATSKPADAKVPDAPKAVTHDAPSPLAPMPLTKALFEPGGEIYEYAAKAYGERMINNLGLYHDATADGTYELATTPAQRVRAMEMLDKQIREYSSKKAAIDADFNLYAGRASKYEEAKNLVKYSKGQLDDSERLSGTYRRVFDPVLGKWSRSTELETGTHPITKQQVPFSEINEYWQVQHKQNLQDTKDIRNDPIFKGAGDARDKIVKKQQNLLRSYNKAYKNLNEAREILDDAGNLRVTAKLQDVFNGTNPQTLLQMVYAKQGFDGLPKLDSWENIHAYGPDQALSDSKGAITLYRTIDTNGGGGGVFSGNGGPDSSIVVAGNTADDWAQQYAGVGKYGGLHYAGTGVYGYGTYNAARLFSNDTASLNQSLVSNRASVNDATGGTADGVSVTKLNAAAIGDSMQYAPSAGILFATTLSPDIRMPLMPTDFEGIVNSNTNWQSNIGNTGTQRKQTISSKNDEITGEFRQRYGFTADIGLMHAVLGWDAYVAQDHQVNYIVTLNRSKFTVSNNPMRWGDNNSRSGALRTFTNGDNLDNYLTPPFTR